MDHCTLVTYIHTSQVLILKLEASYLVNGFQQNFPNCIVDTQHNLTRHDLPTESQTSFFVSMSLIFHPQKRSLAHTPGQVVVTRQIKSVQRDPTEKEKLLDSIRHMHLLCIAVTMTMSTTSTQCFSLVFDRGSTSD
jgi:hypothetical protein